MGANSYVEPTSWLGLIDRVLGDPSRFRRAITTVIVLAAVSATTLKLCSTTMAGAAVTGLLGITCTATVARSFVSRPTGRASSSNEGDTD